VKYRPVAVAVGACLAAAALAPGCAQKTPQVAPPEALVVPVSQPVRRTVTNYVEYTGRLDAVESVGIRARVTGYLVKMPFKEGAEVKRDQLLFRIDPRPYRDQLDIAQAQVALAVAQLALAKTTLARDVQIGPTAVPPQQLDQDRAAVEEAAARLKSAQKSVEVYELNLKFTDVTSPIDGQVSRYYLTLGNLVIQDQTLLTTVVSTNPMYAFFDMDETTLLNIRRAINAGQIKRRTPGTLEAPDVAAGSVAQAAFLPGAGPLAEAAALAAASGEQIPVYMSLPGEDGYPHQGLLNFVNNQVTPATGSISVRAIFQNPTPPGGVRLLTPGTFVRIRLPIGGPNKALLVIDRAVGSDQNLKFVYVLDKDNKVQQRRVTLGALQPDGLRVIEETKKAKPDEGIRPGDWVVVGAMLQVRPRMVVEPERIPMPTLGQATAAAPASGPGAPAGGPARKTRR
jgi:multidrug efflux system membrane fusion protein